MMKSEDEKLSQILRKIEQQKVALNKHLKLEILSLELRKKWVDITWHSFVTEYISKIY